jgi:hypothetical protein
MAGKTWTLTDVDSGTYLESLEVGPSEVGGAAKGYRVTKRRLRGGLGDGVDELTIDNGLFRFVLLPTRGMGLWKAWSGEDELGWQSPVQGPVHPAFVPLMEPSGLGWLDGFDELLVRCGLESNGAPEFEETGRLKYPLHGRIANRPARKVTVEVDGGSGEITVRGVVEETRFLFQKLRLTTTVTTRVGQLGLEIRDEIENLSASPAESQMLYHVNFGFPLLDAGAQVVLPAKKVVPRDLRAASGIPTWDSYTADTPGFEEQVYFLELFSNAEHRTRALLKNAHGTKGVSLTFRTDQLPCFSLWKNTTAAADGYVTGLEPGTNFPNPRSFEGEKGRVVTIPPHGRVELELGLEYHPDSEQVGEAEAKVAQLQTESPQIVGHPVPEWCAE